VSETTGAKVIAALERMAHVKLKQAGRGWRGNSPFRPGSDSAAFSLVIAADGEHGAYHDFVSGEDGSLYELAERLGLEVPRQPAHNTKRVYSGLADYAAAHGAPEEAFRRAGWEETLFEDRQQGIRKALVFKTATGPRWRFLDDKKPTYHSVSNYKSCWYGLNPALTKAGGKPLVICNGEASVVAAQHWGVPAIAVAGGSENGIPEALQKDIRDYPGGLIIALDSDAAGRAGARKISQQFPSAAVIDLGLSGGGDLADFCALYQQASFEKLIAGAVVPDRDTELPDTGGLAEAIRALTNARKQIEYNRTPALDALLDQAQKELDLMRAKAAAAPVCPAPDLVSAAHKALARARQQPNAIRGLRSHFSALDTLIGGWQAGQMYVIYGDTSMGKSTLACSIMSSWIKQGAGLVVSTEMKPERYINKLAAAMSRVPFDRIISGNISKEEYSRVEEAYTSLEYDGANLLLLDAASPTPAQISAALAQMKAPKWLVIDSISRIAVPGSGSIFETMTAAANAAQDWALTYAIPVLVTSQVGRSLKDRAEKRPQLNDALGSGEIERNADVVMALYRHSYYAKLGLADSDPAWPDTRADLIMLKDRTGGSAGKTIELYFIGGAGFYETAPERKT